MPAVDLRLRLRTSTGLRRVLPRRLAIRRATANGRTAWKRTDEREHALRTMRAILGGTSRADELEQLARRRLIEQSVEDALFWQPWQTVSVDGASCANRQLALSSKRRVLLSTCHLGPYFLSMSAFSSVGLSPIAVSAPWFFASPSPDYWGRRLARWRQGLSDRGQRLVCSADAFPVIRALLEQGEMVLNYFDMPGSSRIRFLGKPVMLTGGSARLAFETDALILPLRARRAGDRVWTDFSAPLDPHGFAGAAELHEALARVHERWVLELPHTLEDPNRAGAWEQGASEREWARPGRGSPTAPASAPGNESTALGTR